MISVLAMKLLSDVQAGKYFDSGMMIFDVGADEDNAKYNLPELIPFLVIGVLGGLLGAAFTALNLWVSQIRGAKINVNPRYRVAEIFCIAFISSCLQFLLPFLSSCKYIYIFNIIMLFNILTIVADLSQPVSRKRS